MIDPLENCPYSLPCIYPLHPRSWADPSWAALWSSGIYSGFLCLQQVNMPYVMIPAFPPSHQPLPVTPDSQLALPIQPIPCKPVEYPLQLLHSPPAPVVKRSGVASHHPLQEPPQPLNLTAKPKVPELPNTSSSPSLKMNSCGPRPSSHGAPTRDLQSSPPSLPLGFLGEGDAVTKAIQDARQLLHSHSGALENSPNTPFRKVWATLPLPRRRAGGGR